MKKYAVIVAGGSGTRMGGGIPKQFRSLCGRPMLWWSLKAFHDEDNNTEIILVLPENFISLWEDFFSTLPKGDRFPHLITIGGASRTESVLNGLRLIEDEDSLVAVHDGARPLVSPQTITRGWALAEERQAAVPVVPVVDSLRKITGDHSEAVDRSRFRAVQTPQVFRTEVLLKAYKALNGETFTDDASVVENLGIEIALFEGNPENMKITNPKDLAIAAILLE